MSTHTPGPWTYHNVGGHREILVDGVALVRLTKDATPADAYLIAVAPDLLEALEANFSPEYGHALGCFSHMGAPACSKACKKLKAAIAKAEG